MTHKIITFFSVTTLLFFSQTYSKQAMIENRILADANWGTHQVPLITAALNTTGPILELGIGDFSTPLLHAICSVNKRFLLSVECHKDWLKPFLDLETSWHQFQYIPAYENCENKSIETGGKPDLWDSVRTDLHWGVVFIDHQPAIRRNVDILRFKDTADIIIVHDVNLSPLPFYNHEPVLKTFKYRYTYKRYATQTAVVSNFIDVKKLFENS